MTTQNADDPVHKAYLVKQLLQHSGRELVEQRDEARDWAVHLLSLCIEVIGVGRWEMIRHTPPLDSIPPWVLKGLAALDENDHS